MTITIACARKPLAAYGRRLRDGSQPRERARRTAEGPRHPPDSIAQFQTGAKLIDLYAFYGPASKEVGFKDACAGVARQMGIEKSKS